MTVFITKYALTKGIIEMEGEIVSANKDMIRVGENIWHVKPFWYEKREDAISHANEMRQKAINSLNKRIEKLKNLNFKSSI